MNNLLRWACAAAYVLLPSLASAQSVGSSVIFPSGWAPGQSVCVKQVDGTCVPVSAANPLPVSGGGGGGSSDATAVNQTVTNARLGDTSAPAAGSANQRLGLINTTLGSPFQAGGSIGNTAFGILGSLPAGANAIGTVTAVGNLASGAADAGNPAKVGGVYRAAQPTFNDGNRADLQVDQRGNLRTTLLASDGSSNLGTIRAQNSDAQTPVIGALTTSSVGFYFNGTTIDRARGDVSGAYVVTKGGANIATGQIAVGTAATLIAAARTGRQRIGITVVQTVQCAFGAAGVTLATGWPLAAVAYAADNWDTSSALYGVCATAGTTVAYRELF
ncbi:hypothetical protein [Sphingomonas sp. R86521]|uniref:hypothetical protein n=1 Tax=Sphingomonas sp. R86521 TaxID=3093860 RepID=UPI0036D2D5FE